jgi:hypothetical protein
MDKFQERSNPEEILDLRKESGNKIRGSKYFGNGAYNVISVWAMLEIFKSFAHTILNLKGRLYLWNIKCNKALNLSTSRLFRNPKY